MPEASREVALGGLEEEFLKIKKRLDQLPEDSPAECRTLDAIQAPTKAILALDPDPKSPPPAWYLKLQEVRRWICGSATP